MRVTCFFKEIPFPLIGEIGLFLPQLGDMSHGMKSFELYLENKSIVLILHESDKIFRLWLIVFVPIRLCHGNLRSCQHIHP